MISVVMDAQLPSLGIRKPGQVWSMLGNCSTTPPFATTPINATPSLEVKVCGGCGKTAWHRHLTKNQY